LHDDGFAAGGIIEHQVDEVLADHRGDTALSIAQRGDLLTVEFGDIF